MVSAPVLCEPVVAFAQASVPPVAVQEVALVELQVSVEVPPLAIVVGLAVSVAVGLGATVTVAVAAVLVPPAPVQVRVYVVEVVSTGVVNESFTCCEPVQPPEAVQLVAFLTSQLKELVLPESMVVGLAAKVITGAA